MAAKELEKEQAEMIGMKRISNKVIQDVVDRGQIAR